MKKVGEFRRFSAAGYGSISEKTGTGLQGKIMIHPASIVLF